jgi:hypothetical protein
MAHSLLSYFDISSVVISVVISVVSFQLSVVRFLPIWVNADYFVSHDISAKKPATDNRLLTTAPKALRQLTTGNTAEGAPPPEILWLFEQGAEGSAYRIFEVDKAGQEVDLLL